MYSTYGKQLVNKPVYTDKLYSLGNYIQLNGSDNIDYQYAISFWTFIDAAPPSTSAAYNKYTSLLNFGYKAPKPFWTNKLFAVIETIGAPKCH